MEITWEQIHTNSFFLEYIPVQIRRGMKTEDNSRMAYCVG